jgi:hypothetical protein
MPQDPLARQTDVAAATAAPPATVPSEADYTLFCDMMMATARGRWFLAEYLRRHRKSDTDAVLAALKRIELMLQRADDDDTGGAHPEPARALLTVVPSSPATQSPALPEPAPPAPAGAANSNDGAVNAPARAEPRIAPPVIDFAPVAPTPAPAAIPAPEPSFSVDTDPDQLYVPFEFEPLLAAAQALPDAPPRKPATELFADVMALSPIERIALFS